MMLRIEYVRKTNLKPSVKGHVQSTLVFKEVIADLLDVFEGEIGSPSTIV